MNPGDVISGKYVLERKLGRGGMGEVWLARHRLMDESFAIKFLFPHLLSGDTGEEIVRKFIREAKIGVQVDHPNVVKVRDVDVYGGTYFIVMDYVPGADLKTLIKDRPLTENQIVIIATQVLEALSAAHSRGFIHRDVKPSNILVTRAGKAYLTDFGIAKALDTVASASSTPIFTAEYAAPEQIEPEKYGPVTAATDIYALGVTMYHMATGRPPFTGTTMQVLRQHTDTVARPAVTLNAQLSPHMNGAIMKALAKYPRERFASAAEMVADLHKIPDLQPLTVRNGRAEVTTAPTAVRLARTGRLPNERRPDFGRKVLIGILSVTGALLIAVGLYGVIKYLNTPAAPTATTAKEGIAVNSAVTSFPRSGVTGSAEFRGEPDEPLTGMTMIVPSKVCASSTLVEPSKPVENLGPGKTIDGDIKTAWAEGVNGPGIGEYLTFEFEKYRPVRYIRVIPGFAKDRNLYFGNNRIKRIKAVFNDSDFLVIHYALEDEYGWKVLRVPESYSVFKRIRLEIEDVYPGSRWNDTCISEIVMYGPADGRTAVPLGK